MSKIIVKAVAILIVAMTVAWTYVWWTHIRIHGDQIATEFVSSDGVTLRGSVFLPNAEGPHPGMVFLHGAGPENAEGIAYILLLNAYLKKGFAVLLYDKRGVDRSDGDFDSALYADFVEDALAGVQHLRERSDIADDKIGVLGFSEGGWFTPEVAVRDGKVALVVNRVGPPLSWIDTNLWEIRNELIEGGVTDQELISRLLDLRERIWAYYIDAVAAEDPLTDRRVKLEAELTELGDSWREAMSMRVADYDLDQYRLWVSDITYDPQPFLYQLDVPLLATFGADDQNVPTRESVIELERIRNEYGKSIDIAVYPGRRHSMFKWYNLLTGGYPPDFLDRVSGWSADQVN